MGTSLRALRLCSVFEPSDAALRGRGRRFDDVLTDRALAERLAGAGRERVRRFDWAALARDVLDVYAEALTP